MIEVLRELHDRLARGPCTGEQLAEHFSITRSAVHKRIEQLRALGVQVDAQPGQGYRLPYAVQWLDADTVRARMSKSALSAMNELQVLLQTDSTNARALAYSGAATGVDVFVAESQTAGRGRRGRLWLAPLGGALMFSLSMRVEGGIQRLQGLSLAVGVALAEVLRDANIASIGIKWPNDIQVQGSKLGGILIELDGDAAGPLHAVIGIGLNWRLPAVTREKIDQSVTDILAHNPALERNAFFAQVLDKLLPLLANYENRGFTDWQRRYAEFDALKNKFVRVSQGTLSEEGVAQGIDEQGALLVQVDGKQKRYHGGEVTVRAR
jgi:BirA family transcriptional regulator, biotin operon repressor / biotin---[acetyl-CoA-carboxylase] ligase